MKSFKLSKIILCVVFACNYKAVIGNDVDEDMLNFLRNTILKNSVNDSKIPTFDGKIVNKSNYDIANENLNFSQEGEDGGLDNEINTFSEELRNLENLEKINELLFSTSTTPISTSSTTVSNPTTTPVSTLSTTVSNPTTTPVTTPVSTSSTTVSNPTTTPINILILETETVSEISDQELQKNSFLVYCQDCFKNKMCIGAMVLTSTMTILISTLCVIIFLEIKKRSVYNKYKKGFLKKNSYEMTAMV